MIVTLFFNYGYVFAEDTNSLQQEINNNNDEIEELEKKKENVNDEIVKQQQELLDIDEKIKEKSKDLSKAQEDVAKFQSDIDNLQYEINSIEEQIRESEEQIKLKKKNLSKLQKERDAKQNLLDSRIRSSYKVSISNQYIYILLKSENIWQAYENISQIWRIISLDRELIKLVKEQEEVIANEMIEIDKEIEKKKQNKEYVVSKQAELLEAQKEFIALKEKEESKMNELQLLQDNKQSIISQLEEEERDIAEEIGDLLAYNEDLQRKLDSIFESINNEENNNYEILEQLPADSGFLRPVNGTITDTFGGRINPVTGVPGNHNGIDYANSTGTPILATKNGVVTYSGWIEGYGNTIILDHGEGIQSLYGHAESLAVSVGQAICQGDVVAYVGSTGMSTGPHLHFEIRINGIPVDPFIYIPY
jgi:murein DD-endopeptidase MepM/ murein hydrolase activator NlpD